MIDRQPKFRPVRDNVLNYVRLLKETPADQLQLHYRSRPTSEEDERAATAMLLTTASLGGTGALLLLFLLQTAAFSVGALSMVATFALVFAIYVVVRTGAVSRAVMLALWWVFGWPVLSSLTLLREHILGLALVTASFALFAYLADAVASHYVAWLLASPRLDPAVVDTWKQRWARRLTGGLRAGPIGFLYPLSLLAWAILPGVFLQLASAGTATDPFLISAIIQLVAVLVFLALYHDLLKPIGLVARLPREVVRVLTLWCCYGIKVIPAPGLFRSPKGTLVQRCALTGLVILLLSYWILPAFRFFPAGLSQNPTRWAELYHSTTAQSGLTSLAETMTGFQRGQFVPPPYPERHPGESNEAYQERAEVLATIANAQWQVNEFHRYMRSHAAAWLPLVCDGVRTLKPYYLQAFIFTALNCFLAPLVVFFVLVGTPIALTIALVDRIVGEHGTANRSAYDMTDWACWVERLRGLQAHLKEKHLWLGAHAHDDYPVLLDRGILAEHAYIVGDSGSGKTAIGISSLVRQLIGYGDAPVLILDLKGDRDLFELVRRDATPERFRYFTVQVGDCTHTFNPFDQFTERLSLNQVCETLLEALHLNHGEGYGRSYYSRVARSALAATMRQHPNVANFTELYKLISANRDLDREQKRDAFELVAVIESLANFEQLNIVANRRDGESEAFRNAIHMPTVLKENQVVYFWLPAILEPASVREIAKLALYSLLIAAMQNQTQGHAKQAYVVIDEFQRIASTNFKILLEQARSFGIGALLANQSLADLNMPDCDLRSVVQTNTRLKLTFAATDLEQQRALMDGSGEALDYRYGVTYGDQGVSVTYSEFDRPRLQRNDILRVSDDPNQCIVHIHRGRGYSQFTGFPIPVKCDYTISDPARKELRKLPWPSGDPGTIRVRRAIPPVETEPNRRIEEGEQALAAKAPDAQEPARVDFSDEVAILDELSEKRMRESELFRPPSKKLEQPP